MFCHHQMMCPRQDVPPFIWIRGCERQSDVCCQQLLWGTLEHPDDGVSIMRLTASSEALIFPALDSLHWGSALHMSTAGM